MKKITITVAFLLSGSAQTQQLDAPYSYEDLSKIITALCQKAGYGFRAEVESTCPMILKRLDPQIAAEKAKATADRKDNKQ